MAKAAKSASPATPKRATRTKKTESDIQPINHSTNGNGDLEARIRVRAYELYESRGRLDGAHEADWFAAEAELRSRTA